MIDRRAVDEKKSRGDPNGEGERWAEFCKERVVANIGAE
jgi:hypothetical protein